MSIYSNIDLETFLWVKGEVEVTLENARRELERFASSGDKEELHGLVNQLHQVVGSLQMLELKALSSLILESELLVENFTAEDSTLDKSSLVVLLDESFTALQSTFSRIESGLPENPTDVVELINKIRSIRGQEEIEISSLFSPMIDVFPEVDSQKALRDDVYIRRAKALRVYYQSFMLQWLRDSDDTSVVKIRLVFDKLLAMSTFGAVARLWWVATAYADYIQYNDLKNKTAHSRILRQLDDLFRELELQGESALVRKPGEELIKLMLFYIGVGEKRTERMDEIVGAFSLEEYFPALKTSVEEFDEELLRTEFEALNKQGELPLPLIRQLVTNYFEVEQQDNKGLAEIIEQLQIVCDAAGKHELGVFSEILNASVETAKGIRNGLIERNEDSGFHLASALIFVENSLSASDAIDENWFNNGKVKLRALTALNNQEEITPDMDGVNLTGSERQALLDVVSIEVEENLKMIEENLEEFSLAPTERLLLAGIDSKVRQVRGALQVLGEQKIGLLLKLAEEQFSGLESNELAATPQLLEALAIAVGTMEEYVKGLKVNRQGMDVMLDRSITDLEVVIGKKVSRDDVEDLIDNASDSLFSWLSNQADFELFTNLKSSLRDLNVLAKKTNLRDVEHLVDEQNRLVDVISQEPAFLTDNITSNLQNNMAVITEHIIQLYGTEDTAEEIQSDANREYMKSAIEPSDDDASAIKFHDDMDVSELDEEAEEFDDGRSVTEIGKQNAVEEPEGVDQAIFEVFIQESEEVLEMANEQYAICGQNLDDREAIRELRRAFHTLKGSARMVELNNAAEIAWLSESLFNYVLDTEKPLNSSILGFAREALDEFEVQVEQRYANQKEIDIDAWGAKTEAVSLDQKASSDEPVIEENIEAGSSESTSLESIDTVDSDSVDDSYLEQDIDDSNFVLELSSELVLEESASTEMLDDTPVSVSSTSNLFAQGDDEFDEDSSVSFSVIDDPQMRDVFAHEVENNLQKIREQLEIESIVISEDDVLSISIHTVLGNARTMELTPIANAYDAAERLCLSRQLSNLPLSDGEKATLNALVKETQDCIVNRQDVEPYFRFNHAAWSSFKVDLEAMGTLQQSDERFEEESLEGDTVLIEDTSELALLDFEEVQLDPAGVGIDESLSFVAENDSNEIEISLSELSELDGDAEIEVDMEATLDEAEAEIDTSADIDVEIDMHTELQELEIDVAEQNEAEIEINAEAEQGVADSDEQDSSKRVAAVFEDLDPIDDLIANEEPVASIVDEDLSKDNLDDDNLGDEKLAQDDDLDDLEQSLQAFSDEHSPSKLSDEAKINSDEEPEFEEIEAHSVSLIPDDLTDLLSDDILSVQPEIMSLTPEQDSEFNTENQIDTDDLDELLLGIEQLEPDEPTVDAIIVDEAVTEEKTVTDELVVEEPVVEEPEEPLAEDPVEVEEPEDKIEEVSFIEDESVLDNEDDELDQELRAIYIEEMRNLHTQLDHDVARLSSLSDTPSAMKDILHNLHTIKGSSLMAEANVMGELTHHTETYLEGNFIRNEDDLREIRTTLEMYGDAFDRSIEDFSKSDHFTVPQDLSERLGIASASAIDTEELRAEAEQELERPQFEELEADDQQVSEQLAAITSNIERINSDWKSARGWKKIQPQMAEQLISVQNLVAQDDALQEIAPLVNHAQNYTNSLKLSKAVDFKHSKELLQETYDVISNSINQLSKGQQPEAHDYLVAQLLPSDDSAESSEPENNQKKTKSNLSTTKVSASKFVPGSNQMSEVEQEDVNRQKEAARDRAAALRINTDTLDSLTNFVGDASMNRSQMREDVLSIKSVVENLYNNVQNLNSQLRELEIEADSKITSRLNDDRVTDHGQEFDPLELDRYTKLQQLSRGLAENLDELGGIQNALNNFVHKAESSLQKQERLNRELQDEIMQVRLVTFGGIGPQLRQVVRRTAREVGKDVELEIIGAEVRLDKTILDGVVPALEHMLRNAVDHGIEAPEARSKTKKNKVGKVSVECRQVAREIMILVRDDGVGLDLEKIKTKAVEDNLLAPDQPLNPQDMMMYISQSGFSTASELTQISGRGVGMDVVQTTLRRMSGSILYDLENDNPGSLFTIRLPISLAVSSAMFVESGGEQFAVPARTIERVINLEVETLIKHLKADKPKIEIDDNSYALIDLADYLGYDSNLATLSGKLSVILVNAGVQNIAVIIEGLLDTQEIVVKNLGGHLGRIPIYSGATIRADGRVVLLLDLVGISYYESFVAIPEQNIDITQKIPTVMVVDDSLTVRKSAERDITGLGINSALAKDGLDAQIQLRQEKPDMILLDIEMPRMDGFELLEWIRSQDDLKDVPVVMISSRATEKYINKANELGCSAFLGKPYLLDSLVEAFNEYLDLEAPLVIEKAK